VPPVPVTVSNTQADRAGDTYRELMALDRGMTRNEARALSGAVTRIWQYRAMHAYPLRKVTVGVRQMIETELFGHMPPGRTPRPGQRFKRLDRILMKLDRFPHMRLSQMEDIGGCRAVFDEQDDLYWVSTRIRRRWPHARLIDYIGDPKDDGYRAVHIIERRDGRQIEVQLRTARQHQWAEALETSGPLVGFNLKDGGGPDDLRRYFTMAAERLAREDRREPPDEGIERDFATLREQVRHYFF
jgi:hypothetical protein